MKTLIAAIALTFAANVGAAEFSVAPIRVELGPRNNFSTVTVTNDSDKQITFLLRGTEWTEDQDGKDLYTETENVVFAPHLLRVLKSAPRSLRLGVTEPAGDVERTYRVWLDEQIEASNASSGAQINVSINFGLPIFVAPRVERVAGEVVSVSKGDKGLEVRVHNSGNVHFRVESFKINGAAAPDITSWYLLANGQRTYTVPFDAAWCSQSELKVNVTTTRNEFSKAVSTAGLCGR